VSETRTPKNASQAMPGAPTADLTKRVMISAMHELGSPDLSNEENRRIFGKCCNLHGHNYYLEVTVRGPIDDASGLCCDRDFFEDVLQTEIVNRFHGTNLNDHLKSTTGEELAREFFEILEGRLRPLNLIYVRLQETPKNYFVYGSCPPSEISGRGETGRSSS